MSFIRSLGKLLVILLVALGIAVAAGFAYKAATWNRSESQVMRILKSEAMLFLATDKVTTQVVVEFEENNLLLGSREGMLIATVTFTYGVDLSDLTPESVTREANNILITLPDPKELAFEPDLESMRFATSQSFYTKVLDMLGGNEEIEVELLRMLHDKAAEFAASEDLTPSRQELVNRMNNYTPLIENQFSILGFTPVTVTFQ